MSRGASFTYFCRPLLAMFVVLSASMSSAAPTGGVFLDKGGAAFNVRAYGAAGTGLVNDAPAIQSAISAAVDAGGGIVFFPSGTYRIDVTLSNRRADLVSLIGTGSGSVIEVNTTVGLSLPSLAGVGYSHRASIERLNFHCADIATATAVRMTDMITAPSLTNLTVSNCNVGFDLIDTSEWTERLVATNITDTYNNHLFHYNQNPNYNSNSYGYGTYTGIYINKKAGQDVFYLTGGAYVYHSTFLIKGNFDGDGAGASIFNVQGAKGQACPGASHNTYDIAVEGSGYSVVTAANNGCRPGATGNVLVEGSGSIDATGAAVQTNSLIRTISDAPYLIGILTTTAASSDTLKSSSDDVIPQSDCYVTPKNVIAASMLSTTFVSATNWGSVTVSHPSAVGGIFQVWCSPK